MCCHCFALIVFLSMAGLPSCGLVPVVTLMLCMHYCLVVHNQTCRMRWVQYICELSYKVPPLVTCFSTCSAICRVQAITYSMPKRHSNDMHASNDIKPGNGILLTYLMVMLQRCCWQWREHHILSKCLLPYVVPKQHWMNPWLRTQEALVIHYTTFL